MKKKGSEFCEAQGRGVSWADTEEGRVDSRLLTCACCGSRNMDNTSITRSYREVNLVEDIGKVLKLRDEGEDTDDETRQDITDNRTRQNHISIMGMDPIHIPYNDNGDTKEVDLWRLRSFWPAKKPDELEEEKESLPDYMFDESGISFYFHLHPEFVDEKEVCGEPNKIYTAMICSHCERDMKDNKYPQRSIAAGVDFGDANRIGLEPLTDRERQIISKFAITY